MKEIEPIAHFRSPFTSKFGIPRQSGLITDLQGSIVFETKYRREEALHGLEEFDYLWLIWGFSANSSKNKKGSLNLTVRPPRLGGNKRIGVFASRSPFRPNGLGLSSVKIVEVKTCEIVVRGADLMDGTPIYDIKPYLPYVDSHPEAKGGFTDRKGWKTLEVVFPEELKAHITANELEILKKALAQDPRPKYQHDVERIYGMPFGGKDVKFRIDGKKCIVTDITALERNSSD